MKKRLLLYVLISFITIETISANTSINSEKFKTEKTKDSLRLAELDRFWNELSRTVREGDFEAYAKAYHKDAVVVFAAGENKTSTPIAKALASWKQGFTDTKQGTSRNNVTFRFSQRIGDETTAHETGIFVYTTSNSNGENEKQYIIHFEMLLVKRNSQWFGVMEYQKSAATLEEWNALY